MLNTLVLFTYLDVHARLCISDLRISSDRRTILIGRGPHLAMIPSPGKVAIRMNISFTPKNHLKQLSQYEWFVSRNIWTRFPSSEMWKRVVQVWELRDLTPVPLKKAAQTDNFTLVNPKVSLCSARRGEPRSILLSSKHNTSSDNSIPSNLSLIAEVTTFGHMPGTVYYLSMDNW